MLRLLVCIDNEMQRNKKDIQQKPGIVRVKKPTSPEFEHPFLEPHS